MLYDHCIIVSLNPPYSVFLPIYASPTWRVCAHTHIYMKIFCDRLRVGGVGWGSEPGPGTIKATFWLQVRARVGCINFSPPHLSCFTPGVPLKHYYFNQIIK
jgi:hypothetical protein